MNPGRPGGAGAVAAAASSRRSGGARLGLALAVVECLALAVLGLAVRLAVSPAGLGTTGLLGAGHVASFEVSGRLRGGPRRATPRAGSTSYARHPQLIAM